MYTPHSTYGIYHTDYLVQIDGPAEIWSLLNLVGDKKLGELWDAFINKLMDYSMSIGSCSVFVSDWTFSDLSIKGNGYQITIDLYVGVDQNETPDQDEGDDNARACTRWFEQLNLGIGPLSIKAIDLKGWREIFVG